MNSNRPYNKRISQVILAGMVTGLGVYANANDFAIENGALQISNGTFNETLTVAPNGIVSTPADEVPLSNDFGMPDFSFDLLNLDNSIVDGDYGFKVAVVISDDNSNRRLEAFLGELTLTVNGPSVTGSIPGGQNLVVIGRTGSSTGTVVIANNASGNGPVTIDDGTVQFSGTSLVDRLKNSNAAFAGIIDSFDEGGHYTYTIAVQQTSGTTTRFGSENNNVFSPLPRIRSTCALNTGSETSSVFLLNGVVNNNQFRVSDEITLAYAVQGKFTVEGAAGNPGSALSPFTENCTQPVDPDPVDPDPVDPDPVDPDPVDPDPVDPDPVDPDPVDPDPVDPEEPGEPGELPTTVSQADIDAVNADAASILNAAELELAANGVVSAATAENAAIVAQNGATITGKLADALEAGGTIMTSNTLFVLEAAAAAANSAVFAAANSNSASAQETVREQNTDIIHDSAILFASLASDAQEEGTELSALQVTRVQETSANLLTAATALLDNQTSPAQLAGLASDLNIILDSNTQLGVPATPEFLAQVKALSDKLVNTAIAQVLDISGLDDDEVADLLTQNESLIDELISLSLNIPATDIKLIDDTRDDIADKADQNGVDLDEEQRNRLAATLGKAGISQTANVVIPGSGQTIIEMLRELFGVQGPAQAALSISGRNTAAVTTADAAINVDEATGAVTIILPGETYAGALLSAKTVPETMPEGLRFRRDGSFVAVHEGVAVILAPTALDLVSFAAAVEDAGYPLTLRQDGSVTLDLGNHSRFSGAFAYDNLDGINTANCGPVSIVEPTGPLNGAAYAYGISCMNNDVEQRIMPYVHASDFYNSIMATGLSVATDRNTGFVTIEDVGTLKPGYFIDRPTQVDLGYLEANKDEFGVAYQALNANNDGIVDYKIITADSVQIMYGVN